VHVLSADYGFVVMHDAKGARAAATALNGYVVDKHAIQVMMLRFVASVSETIWAFVESLNASRSRVCRLNTRSCRLNDNGTTVSVPFHCCSLFPQSTFACSVCTCIIGSGRGIVFATLSTLHAVWLCVCAVLRLVANRLGLLQSPRIS
jgi:hypothetical protein